MPQRKVNSVEAFRLAHDWAIKHDCPWEADFSVMWMEKRWHVATNCGALSCNLEIAICPKTGKVLKADWNPE